MMKGRLLIFCTILMVIICGAFTTTATEAQAGGCSQTHIVQRGENLYRIALLYHTTIADLQARNAINNPNHIFAGQRLCVAGGFVPPATPIIPPNNTWDNIGIVTVYRLNIRSGPGIQYPIVRLAAQGEGLRLVGRSTDSRWYQVLDDPTSGRFVWVSAAYVQAPHPERLPVAQTGTYTAFAPLIFDATVYSGPNTLVAIPPYEIFAGTFVNVIGRNIDATWFQVETSLGTGWLRLDAFPNAFARYEFAVTG